MSTALSDFNAMTDGDARSLLKRACGATNWAHEVVRMRPFEDVDGLVACAHAVWSQTPRSDILEAFEHHPRIGANVDELRQKFASTADMSEGEQSGVSGASEETLLALRDGNLRYENRYGHIFIVCASGKSAGEMLALLNARIDNEPTEELQIAAAEQAKITELRLRGMFR